MIRKTSIHFVTLSFLVLASVPIKAQSGGEQCAIQITEPQAGQEVPKELTVKGAATLPPGHHLWIFIRPVKDRTESKWHPQAEGFVVDPNTHEWEGPAWLDPQKNAGGLFDVTAAVFSQVQHTALVQYMAAGPTNNYPAIPMPSTACAASPLTVRKVKSEESRNPD